MDINNNQQVNTFMRGMNTDISDALIDSSQYRYAENLRLITNTDSNTGELHLIDGTVPSGLSLSSSEHIIYMGSVRNYLYVIVQVPSSIPPYDGTWILYVCNNYGQTSPSFAKIFGACTEPIWANNSKKAISTVVRWESDNNIKLYIADDVPNHGIMCVNIDEEHWPDQTDQNNVPRNFKLLTGYQNIFLQSPSVNISSQYGNIVPAKVQYAYRVFKNGGAVSDISTLSEVLSIYKNNKESYSDKELSDKAVDIRVDLDDPAGINSIEIYRISYIQNGQQPSVHLILSEKNISFPFVYTDKGHNIEQLSVTEFLSLVQNTICPSIIESKNDYLFAANLHYKQDDVDAKLKTAQFDAIAVSNGNYWKNSSGQTAAVSFTSDGKLNRPSDGYVLCHNQFNGDYADSFNFTPIYNKSWWHTYKVDAHDEYVVDTDHFGGRGSNVSWEYIYATPGEGINGYDPWISLSPDQGYDKTVMRHGFKHDETYRFGIIIYDENGAKSSVNWIADIRIPPFCTKDYGEDKYPFGADIVINPHDDSGNPVSVTGVEYKVRQYGIKFTVRGLPSWCSGFLIVRCPRTLNDTRVITQGIVYAPLRLFEGVENNNVISYMRTNYIAPSGFATLLKIESRHVDSELGDKAMKTYSTYDVVCFASPEYVYQPDDIKDILSTYKSNISLEHVGSYHVFSGPKTGDGGRIVSWQEPKKSIYFTTAARTDNTRMLELSNDDKDGNRDSDILIEVEPITDKKGYISFNHTVAAAINGVTDAERAGWEIVTYPEITNIAYPEVPKYNSFSNEGNIRFKDDVTVLGSDEYVNWSYALFLKSLTGSSSAMANALKNDLDGDWARYYYPLGTGGMCILFGFNQPMSFGDVQLDKHEYYYLPANQDPDIPFYYKEYLGKVAPLHIANVVKQVDPYGGYNLFAINNSSYIQQGDTYKRTNAEMLNSSDASIEVTSGDSYTNLFVYHASHAWDDPTYITATMCSTVCVVPLESDIDLRAAYGDLFDGSVNKGYYMQDEPASFDGYTQDEPAYLYNTAYNQSPNVQTLSSTEYTDISSNNYDTRIHYSQLKTNGESIDSWSLFKPLDYIDVDSRYGEITQLDLFKDKLVFWQNNATGVLTVNERTIVNTTDDNEIVLGSGGVLNRYDYITTKYGMKPHQFVDTYSNSTLYWWDGYAKEILGYTDGHGMTPLSSTKQIKNYINSKNEATKPSMFYDLKYKELVAHVVGNESIAYNEQVEAFTSVYGNSTTCPFSPRYHAQINENILVSSGGNLDKYNESTVNGTSVTANLFDNSALPYLKYIINNQNTNNKVFDITTFGGRFYGGANELTGNDNEKHYVKGEYGNTPLNALSFTFSTPLKQSATISGSAITNREFDYRLDIPRNGQTSSFNPTTQYGNRLRGKTMQCELTSTSNSTDFSLQYIITKYRMSWS